MLKSNFVRTASRRFGVVMAAAPALLVLSTSLFGQSGGKGPDWGPRTGLCTRCFQIYWFMGGGDGSFHPPAGMLRNELCPACDVSATYEKPPPGTPPSKSANDARQKHQGVSQGANNHKKRQGDLPQAEYESGLKQLNFDLRSLEYHWKHLKKTIDVSGAISDSGPFKIGTSAPPLAMDKVRTALRDSCLQKAEASIWVASEEQDQFLLEAFLFALAMPEKKNEASKGLGRLVQLHEEAAVAYRRLAVSLVTSDEKKVDEGIKARPYYQPVSPHAELLSTSEKDNSSWIEACNHRIRINALVNAASENWTRHQRAIAKQDLRAAAGLSTRIIEQAIEARKQSIAEASAMHEFHTARVELLRQALKANPEWTKQWERLRQQALTDKKLPTQLADAYSSLGLRGTADDSIRKILVLDSAKVEKVLSEHRGRLGAISEVRKILQKDKLSWPEPFDDEIYDWLEFLGRRVFPDLPARVLYSVGAMDSGWWAVPSGGPVDFRRRGVMHSSFTTQFLTPGKYDIWIPLKHPERPDLPPAVRVYSGIDVGNGKPEKPLRKPDSLPAVKKPNAFGEFQLRAGDGIASPYSWFMFPHDADYTEQAVKGTSKFEPLKVPVGKYDLYWLATADHRPLVLARDIEIVEGKNMTREVNAGLRLDRGEGVPAHLSNGWWAATLPGQAPVRRTNWTSTSDRLPLPPGEYDVYWSYAHAHLAVRIARSVHVKADAWTPVRADTALAVRLPKDFPKIQDRGWLAVTVAGSDDLVDLRFGKETNVPLVVPPGDYDLFVQVDEKTPRRRIRAGVTVAVGKVTELSVEPEKTK